jgi:hypothetical protein
MKARKGCHTLFSTIRMDLFDWIIDRNRQGK